VRGKGKIEASVQLINAEKSMNTRAMEFLELRSFGQSQK
jgi:hypothetical protein